MRRQRKPRRLYRYLLIALGVVLVVFLLYLILIIAALSGWGDFETR